MNIINLKSENHVHIQKRTRRARRTAAPVLTEFFGGSQEEIESLKQTIRELQSEVADDRICGC